MVYFGKVRAPAAWWAVALWLVVIVPAGTCFSLLDYEGSVVSRVGEILWGDTSQALVMRKATGP